VHNRHYDEAFFVTKFVNGLRKDIQRAIRLHGPKTVDAALILAETQEELADEIKPNFTSRYKHDYRMHTRSALSGKGLLGSSPDELKKTEEKTVSKPPWDEKFHSLKAQRRARNECFTCGDKFHPGHKCNKSVPLHMVEELLGILQSSDSNADKNNPSSSDESLMHISPCALAGTTNHKSIRLQGTVKGKQVLILIDSGSCGNFISSIAVAQLGLPTQQVDAVTIQVANGAKE
jgi:hypothetical protein